jgi:hypothetical protein
MDSWKKSKCWWTHHWFLNVCAHYIENYRIFVEVIWSNSNVSQPANQRDMLVKISSLFVAIELLDILTCHVISNGNNYVQIPIITQKVWFYKDINKSLVENKRNRNISEI